MCGGGGGWNGCCRHRCCCCWRYKSISKTMDKTWVNHLQFFQTFGWQLHPDLLFMYKLTKGILPLLLVGVDPTLLLLWLQLVQLLWRHRAWRGRGPSLLRWPFPFRNGDTFRIGHDPSLNVGPYRFRFHQGQQFHFSPSFQDSSHAKTIFVPNALKDL